MIGNTLTIIVICFVSRRYYIILNLKNSLIWWDEITLNFQVFVKMCDFSKSCSIALEIQSKYCLIFIYIYILLKNMKKVCACNCTR